MQSAGRRRRGCSLLVLWRAGSSASRRTAADALPPPLRRAAARVGAVTMQYRVDFLVGALMAVFYVFWNVVPLFVLWAQRADHRRLDARGGAPGDRLVHLLARDPRRRGQPSLQAVVEHIRKGTLDFVLLKPADAQFLVSTARFEVVQRRRRSAARRRWRSGRCIGCIACRRPAQIAARARAHRRRRRRCSTRCRSWSSRRRSGWCASTTSSICSTRCSTPRAGRRRCSAACGASLFTFVVPLALMTTYPALALLGRLDGGTALRALGGALAFVLAGARGVAARDRPLSIGFIVRYPRRVDRDRTTNLQSDPGRSAPRRCCPRAATRHDAVDVRDRRDRRVGNTADIAVNDAVMHPTPTTNGHAISSAATPMATTPRRRLHAPRLRRGAQGAGDLKQGFACPCHGATYDANGRESDVARAGAAQALPGVRAAVGHAGGRSDASRRRSEGALQALAATLSDVKFSVAVALVTLVRIERLLERRLPRQAGRRAAQAVARAAAHRRRARRSRVAAETKRRLHARARGARVRRHGARPARRRRVHPLRRLRTARRSPGTSRPRRRTSSRRTSTASPSSAPFPISASSTRRTPSARPSGCARRISTSTCARSPATRRSA